MGFVFVDDLQMRTQVSGQTKKKAPLPAKIIFRGSAAKMTHLARELCICFCVRIDNFSNARARRNTTLGRCKTARQLVTTEIQPAHRGSALPSKQTSIVNEPRARALGCPSVCQQQQNGARALKQQPILRKLGQSRAEC